MKKIFLFSTLFLTFFSVIGCSNSKDNESISKPSKVDIFWHSFISQTLMAPFYKNYINKLPVKNTDTIMDFGAGWGAEAKILVKRLKNGRLTCMDISPEWITKCKEVLSKYDNVDYLAGDICAMDTLKQTYDAIVIHMVLHDIAHEQRTCVLNALSKHLKQEGKIFLREPLLTNRKISIDDLNILLKKTKLKTTAFNFKWTLFYGNTIELTLEKSN